MTGEFVFDDVAELLLKAFFSFSLKGIVEIRALSTKDVLLVMGSGSPDVCRVE